MFEGIIQKHDKKVIIINKDRLNRVNVQYHAKSSPHDPTGQGDRGWGVTTTNNVYILVIVYCLK